VIHLADAQATHSAGMSLAPHLRPGDVIALEGDLGAGKTSLARGILAGLGLTEEAPSPSYALVIPYDPPLVRLPVWHVDLYRIEAPQDVEALTLDDALFDGALLIEWPERLGHNPWPETLKLSLSHATSGGRSLTAKAPPSWEGRCPFS
jgi:tRNA threonylcarbamoyladenosine biosynthesis protein TsaE